MNRARISLGYIRTAEHENGDLTDPGTASVRLSARQNGFQIPKRNQEKHLDLEAREFGTRGSEVQILSPRPIRSITYHPTCSTTWFWHSCSSAGRRVFNEPSSRALRRGRLRNRLQAIAVVLAELRGFAVVGGSVEGGVSGQANPPFLITPGITGCAGLTTWHWSAHRAQSKLADLDACIGLVSSIEKWELESGRRQLERRRI